MLTSLLIKIKHTCPWLWHGVENINALIMAVRYPRLKATAADEIANLPLPQGIEWSIVTPDDAPEMSAFLNSIPQERVKWFNPHPFDSATISSMAASRSFVMFKVTHHGKIAGYHFLRCFFIGKAFHGLIVSDGMTGRGIGTLMWRLGAAICTRNGMIMEATIHRDNIASLTSCTRGCGATVAAQLPDGYLLMRKT